MSYVKTYYDAILNILTRIIDEQEPTLMKQRP